MAQRRTADDIQQAVTRSRESGLTQAEHCRQDGIVLSTLGRYLRRSSKSVAQAVVRVKVAPAAEPQDWFVLMLGNGRRTGAGWTFRNAELARLIRVVQMP